MSPDVLSCHHEPDVAAAIVEGRWDDDAHAALREHARVCAVCRDVVEIACALAPEPGESVTIPAAGQVLWRARVRARAEAARRATRPLLVAQALAAACVIGLLAGLLSWLQPGALARFAAPLAPLVTSGFGLVASGLFVGSLVVASLAVYFVVVRE
ncbi:MAG TPA: hypothetical protein VF198_07285 [Vicinamibacterales bacterium]